jgi:general secretion pathway protein J
MTAMPENVKSGRFLYGARGGFTLIEVLLAVTLLSVILAALYSTFFLSQKAMDGMEGTLVKLQESRGVLDTMRKEVEALAFSSSDKYSSCRVEDRDMYGKQASRFTFSAFTPLAPGLAQISYYLEEKEGKLILLKKMKPAFREGNDKEQGVELIEDIEAFGVEARDGDTWLKTWDSAMNGKPPDEIKVTVKMMLKERSIVLYETIRPKIGKTL